MKTSTKQFTWQAITTTERTTLDVRVWLARPGDAMRNNNNHNNNAAPWQPLRHVDCRALRSMIRKDPEHPHPVLIEAGRATADPVANLIFYNFFRGPQRQLTSAVWFVRDTTSKSNSNNTDSNSGDTKITLVPIENTEDEDKIESLYQNAVYLIEDGTHDDVAAACPEVTLSDHSKVRVVWQGKGDLMLKRLAPGWFGHSEVLQRGYGPFVVEGEAEEMALGPVRSLVFCIHGIGEAYFSKTSSQSSSSSSSFVPGLIEQINATRVAVQKRQIAEWHKQCEKAKKNASGENETPPPPPCRIEFLPLEWFQHVHNEQSDLMQSLQAVTLSSIPALRTIANDIVFDVLVYLTPRFGHAILQCVTEQIISLYRAFCKVHPHFAPSEDNNGGAGGGGGGHVSLVGHSLGSVICWDLLAILHDHQMQPQNQKQSSTQKPHHPQGHGVTTTNTTTASTSAAADSVPDTSHGTWGPTLPEPMTQVLPFTPHNVILLGSPLGMFLSLRGAHKVFDQMRHVNNDDGGGSSSKILPISPFTMPTTRFINIFNASDPVAYRIEPLLVSPNVPRDKLPPPAYLVAPGKDVRLHVKARQLGDGIRKSLMETTASSSSTASSAWSAVLGTVTAAVAATTGTHNEALAEEAAAAANRAHGGDSNSSASNIVPATWKFPLGGTSDRVDYAFQPALVDNEYLSAVLAHSTATYFMNGDFLDWMVHHLPAAATATTAQ